MPGSPPTAPRSGAPRYSDAADPASFSSQVNGVTDAFDLVYGKRLTPVLASSAHTAADHEAIVALDGITITLPTPSSEHELIAVHAQDDAGHVSGSSPVTVKCQLITTRIYGKGLGSAGVNQIVLGTPGAFAWFYSDDGANWRIVAGEQDTGYVAFTSLGTGVSNVGNAGYRLRGGDVRLHGVLSITSTVTGGSTLVNLPGGTTPAANRQFVAAYSSNSGAWQSGVFQVGVGGVISSQQGITAPGQVDLSSIKYDLL